MKRAISRLGLFAGLWLLAACSGGSGQPQPLDTHVEETLQTVESHEVFVPSDSTGDDQVRGETTAPIDWILPTDAQIAPGEFGAPCTENSDCIEDWCVESNNGRICSKRCMESCPSGFSCRIVMGSYPDAVSICLPNFLRLCAPCQSDSQCIGGVCTRIEGEGYCTRTCSAADPCPDTYECEAHPLADGVSEAMLCMPQTGSCGCGANSAGQLRACSQQNEFGTCYGFEACDPQAGWQACDALLPAEEICDGLDNDCDALLDEGLPDSMRCSNSLRDIGECPGTAYCRGSLGWVCDAAEPTLEACDMQDNDCDGYVDEDFKVDAVYGLDEHCGGCYINCEGKISHGSAKCNAAADPPHCVVDQCETGYLPAGELACVPMSGTPCRACENDSDCAFPGDACLPLLDGRYCGVDCSAENAHGTPDQWCDTGYVCLPDDEGNGAHCHPVTESCTCTPDDAGQVRICLRQSSAGTCYGQETCDPENGWVGCSAAEPQDEFCNGNDDDCNGIPDDLPGVGDSCTHEAAGVGVCTGTWVCTADSPALVCSAAMPQLELCNQVDDDCDGSVDEDFPEVYHVCTAGLGACQRNGIYLCATDGSAAVCSVAPGQAAMEVCNGLDDDCNGLTDDEGSQGCLTYYTDEDNDTFGALEEGHCRCTPSGAVKAVVSGDCDDQLFHINPAAPEICDGHDNDCDGATDEGVLSECDNCDPHCQVATIGPAGDEPFTPTSGNSSGVGQNGTGALEINTNNINLSFIWIVNSADDTVSRLDTTTGWEDGRYLVCDDPSRTAVDLFGNVYVGCRGDDRVAKILLDHNRCQDRNGDGLIQTAVDINGDHRIKDAEVLPAGEDECVAWIAAPFGMDLDAQPQGLVVDRDNFPWVGYYNPLGGTGYIVQRLHPDTGTPIRQITGLSAGPFGMVVDHQGRMWLSGRNGDKLLRVDIESDPAPVHTYTPPGACVEPYGIVVDKNGHVWLANSQCPTIYHFDPGTEAFTEITIDAAGLGSTRGLATSKDGWLMVAHHTGSCGAGRSVTKINVDTHQIVANIPLATGGILGTDGMDFDYRGFLWAVNQCTNTVTKVDTTHNTIVASYPIGSGPDTFGDMTGYNLHVFTAPNGFYRHTVAGCQQYGTQWQTFDVGADLPTGSELRLRLRTANTVYTLQQTPWSDFLGPFPPASLPLDLSNIENLGGSYMEIEIWLFSREATVTPTIEGIRVQSTCANVAD